VLGANHQGNCTACEHQPCWAESSSAVRLNAESWLAGNQPAGCCCSPSSQHVSARGSAAHSARQGRHTEQQVRGGLRMGGRRGTGQAANKRTRRPAVLLSRPAACAHMMAQNQECGSCAPTTALLQTCTRHKHVGAHTPAGRGLLQCTALLARCTAVGSRRRSRHPSPVHRR
jgi:hypothetical protein